MSKTFKEFIYFALSPQEPFLEKKGGGEKEGSGEQGREEKGREGKGGEGNPVTVNGNAVTEQQQRVRPLPFGM